MTAAAVVAAPRIDLSEAGARALLADIRTAITAAQDLLRTAWFQRIWLALDYPSWDAFVAAELGDLRLKLPVDDRRAEVATWRAEGASLRAISTALGVSVGTVAGDLEAAVPLENSSVVVSLDGRRRPSATTHRPGALTARPVSLRVLDALAAAGADGHTFTEISRKLRTRDGTTTSALHRLERDGHCTRPGLSRDGRSIYLLANYL